MLPALERWVGVFDEPFGDQAALPTMLLAEYARRDVTVVLTGEGADEVFGGYGNYVKRLREERITAILGARGSPLPWLHPAPAAAARPRPHRSRPPPSRARAATRRSRTSSTRSCAREYFTDAFRQAGRARIADRAEIFHAECDSPAYLDHLLNIDARLWLPDDLLAKVDRATMAFSLEARVPYLDHDFYGWCARLDPGLKVRGDARKLLLKALAARYLPADIVDRPKQGFMMPLERWLARELAARHRRGARAAGALRGAG